MRILILLLLTNWITLEALGERITFHLIIVSDTDDATIGEGCQKNIDRLTTHFKPIAKHLKMSYKSYVLKGDQVNGDSIIYLLKNKVKIKRREDIVVFHYSGHGTNRGSKDVWPRFLIPNGFKSSLTKIHGILETKKPKFLLTLADCCNGASRRRPTPRIEIEARNQPVTILSKKNYYKLFQEAEGDIIACASRKGAVSYYDSYLGGYFSLGFCEAMTEEVNALNTRMPISWESIFLLTEEYTSNLATGWGRRQQPQIKINLKKETDQIPIFGEEPTNEIEVTIYQVKKGDTLSKIAKTYKITVVDLKKWNNLKSSLIRRKQKLKIYLSPNSFDE